MNLTPFQIAIFVSQALALIVACKVMLSSTKKGFGPSNRRIFLAVILCPPLLIIAMGDTESAKAAWGLLGTIITFAVSAVATKKTNDDEE
jgi:hypothetical protein